MRDRYPAIEFRTVGSTQLESVSTSEAAEFSERVNMRGFVLISLILLDAFAVFSLPFSRSAIVGGEDAPEGDWWWIVALVSTQNPKNLLCGGTIVSRQWVVTAAHCVNKQTIKHTSVRLGVLKLSENSPQENIYQIARMIIHPKYVDHVTGDDVALLQLDRLVQVPGVGPWTELANAGDTFDTNTACYVAGWGRIKEGEPLGPPQTLQEALVPIVPNDVCKESYPKLRPEMVCAGEAGRDSCQGDSGGPLMCYTKDRWVLAGIVSYGNGCGRPDFPGVYTRVSSYRDFINNNIHLFPQHYAKVY